MRSIKFRGLLTSTQQFIIGDLYQDGYSGKTFITEFIGIESGESITELREVIPESVGQFTGLHDKNGVEIYENDIISISSRGFDFDCQVTYDKQLIPVGEKSKGWEHMLYSPYWEQCEVVGTIHDRKEVKP